MTEPDRTGTKDELEYWLNQPVSSLELRVRSLNGLDKSGIKYIHELVLFSESDLYTIPNLGRDSIVDINTALQSVGLVLEMNVSVEENDDTFSLSPDAPPPEVLKSISVSRLGFSVRTINCLKSENILSAFDLVTTSRPELQDIRNMGKNCLSETDTVISTLKKSCDASGNFLMSRFVENSGLMSVLPVEYTEKSPNDFITALPVFFQEFVQILDEREQYIATSRIWPASGNVSTLENIAGKFEITRERVRQIEKKVVKKLTGLLCENAAVKSKLNKKKYICNPDFSATWIRAADTFEGIHEMEIHSFTEKLCQIWKVDINSLISVLPLVIVAFTRSTTTVLSRDIKNDSPILALMINASNKTRMTRLSSFRIGKHSKILSESGIENIDDVHKNWPLTKTRASGHIIQKLISAQKYMDDNGDLDWNEYRHHLDLTFLTVPTPQNTQEFFSSLNEFISSGLPYLTTWKHCKDVFDHRTRHSAGQRKTLKDCAKIILGQPKFGPHIARIEKYLLEKISSVFVFRDFSYANVWIPKAFLHYVLECQIQYESSNGDYQRFCTLLGEHYSLPRSEVLNCSAVLWGMLDGLPPDRYHHLFKRKTPEISTPVLIEQKIKLVGFRKVH